MNFTLTFDTDNAAFEGDLQAEVARILRSVANKVEDGDYYGPVKDINGNTVGSWDLDEPEDDDDGYEEEDDPDE